MQLTKEQLEAVRNGQPVRLQEEGTAMILVRADLFEKLERTSYDDAPWTDEEMDLLAAEDADALGWEGMEVYEDEGR